MHKLSFPISRQRQIKTQSDDMNIGTKNMKFDWMVYCTANRDIWHLGIKTERDALTHFSRHNKIKNQVNLPNFDWENYVSIYGLNIDNRLDALDHWFSIGKNNNLSYSRKRNKKMYVLLSHNGGGGLSKYVNDIISNINDVIDINAYDVITNERKKVNGSTIHIKSDNILDYININNKFYDETIIHFNIFPHYKKYNIKTIDEQFNKFFSLTNCKIIITVHDFFWLFQQEPNILIKDFDSTEIDQKHIDIIEKIFEKAYIVIFPTNFCLSKYREKGIKFTNVNYIVSEHIDVGCNEINDIKPYYNTIIDKIDVLVLGNHSLCKGYDVLQYLIKNNKQIIFHLVGQYEHKINDSNIVKHGMYDYRDIHKIINRIKPHICLLLSNFYETYSYVTSICIKTGLPIFYNKDVYSERLSHRLNTNIYSYDKDDEYKEIDKKFAKCMIDILEKSENSDIKYKKLDDDVKFVIPDLYKNMLGETTDKISDYISNMKSRGMFNEEINEYIKTLISNNVECKNLILVTSKIIVSNNKFNYVNKRSIYTIDERFEQTKNTINSIKKYIPDNFIILFDNSNFCDNVHIYNYLKDNVNIFMNPQEGQILYNNTNICPYKQIGELSQMKFMLRYVIKFIKFKNIFKISGRYTINDKFDYKIFDNEHNIFRKNTNVLDRNYYYTCFYKISNKNFNEYVTSIDKVYEKAILDKKYAAKDLEVTIPEELKFDFLSVDVLGLTQNIAVWKQNDDI